MLDVRYVADHLEEVRAALVQRGFKDEGALAEVSRESGRRRELIVALEELRAERNRVSKTLSSADKASSAFAEARERMRGVGEEIKSYEEQLRSVEAALDEVSKTLPNLPSADTPPGLTEDDNPVVRTGGERPSFSFAPKDHVELGLDLGIFDFERAVKISGSRFSLLRGAGARLERALLNFMVELHTQEHGYTEMWPPVLIKDVSMEGTGQLPKFKNDSFRIAMEWDAHGAAEGHELYLAPTAEVPLTNLHREEILDGASLPIRYAAYTPCFRSEAGSYGKDTRGSFVNTSSIRLSLCIFAGRSRRSPSLKRSPGTPKRCFRDLGFTTGSFNFARVSSVFGAQGLRPRGVASGAESVSGDLELFVVP